jgi:phage/plasmid-associated DNA primase
MLILPWKISIPEGDRVQGMDTSEWWIASGEMPAILNWSLEGLVHLIIRGRFSESEDTRRALEDYQLETNPAREFLYDSYQVEEGELAESFWVTCSEVYKEYSEWCKERGYHPLGCRMFGKEVSRAFHGVQRSQVRVGYDREWRYVGLRKAE